MPARFNGPASSGNGGWTAGALAEASGLPEPVTVRLRVPPPLDTPLDVVAVDGSVELRHGSVTVARATGGGPDPWPAWEPVAPAQGRAAQAAYPGFRSHPFPRCFSCGPDREDGLRIFPGPLGDGRVAAAWTPDEPLLSPRLRTPATWAALDCVSAWSSDLEHRPLVLGQMCARVRTPPQAGAAYAVVGVTRRVEGRKTFTASAMFDQAGALVAQAEHVWVAVDAETVARLQR